MTDWKNVFDQPVINNFRTYEYSKKLQQTKEMITQLVSKTIITS